VAVSVDENLCRRLGELLRQEQDRVQKMKMEGHRVYQEYVQHGKDAKVSKQVCGVVTCHLVAL